MWEGHIFDNHWPVPNESLINPYIGRPVGAVLPDGEVVCGIVECIHNGNLVLRPLGIPEAAIQKIKNRVASDPRFRAVNLKLRRNVKPMTMATICFSHSFAPLSVWNKLDGYIMIEISGFIQDQICNMKYDLGT
ncbi:hypothetical protein LJK88_33200 [Paenibacillus sp. P26]|nr:hypothetical protein LJK88_33200 [Paenibacillus sp. P26]UUZ93993.1 hypothetical protein LJK87_04900 [Paenibacillus sp. P25]